jgi:hypothetical protein
MSPLLSHALYVPPSFACPGFVPAAQAPLSAHLVLKSIPDFVSVSHSSLTHKECKGSTVAGQPCQLCADLRYNTQLSKSLKGTRDYSRAEFTVDEKHTRDDHLSFQQLRARARELRIEKDSARMRALNLARKCTTEQCACIKLRCSRYHLYGKVRMYSQSPLLIFLKFFDVIVLNGVTHILA